MALDNPFDFSGTTVLLAGATGGLGYPVSLAFAKAGANVAGCARSGDALDGLLRSLPGSKGGILTEKVDLCDEQAGRKFRRQAHASASAGSPFS